MPLVVNGLGGVHAHTHMHTHTFADKSDFKKPGARQLQGVPGLKTY